MRFFGIKIRLHRFCKDIYILRYGKKTARFLREFSLWHGVAESPALQGHHAASHRKPESSAWFTFDDYKHLHKRTNKQHLHVSIRQYKYRRYIPHYYYAVLDCTYNISLAWTIYHAFRSHICSGMNSTSGVTSVPTTGHELKTSMCCGNREP
jgi:hypothetical protein